MDRIACEMPSQGTDRTLTEPKATNVDADVVGLTSNGILATASPLVARVRRRPGESNCSGMLRDPRGFDEIPITRRRIG